MESKYLFNNKDKDKLLTTEVCIEPSHSAFLKKRLEIMFHNKDYQSLLNQIKEADIHKEKFKVEYLVLDGDETNYNKRLNKLKDIGYLIEGNPDYYKPTTTYALCYYNETWCFGLLTKNSYSWNKHKKKPFSFSNSINIHIAKALVNIATKADKSTRLFDACCGVGTIMLEACYAGYHIEGCDINWKVCRQSRNNLAHFDYESVVYRSDVKDIEFNYDVSIIDLPYNLFSSSDDETMEHIIKSASQISPKLVIVSADDISKILNSLNLKIIDQCLVPKSGNTKFSRTVWVVRNN
jgi:tRNA G10  N-methylase Trm11